MVQADSVDSTHALSMLPGHLNSETIRANGSGLGCHLGWTYSGIYIVWTNGAEISAHMSVHILYTSNLHIWLLFLPMAPGVCPSGAKGWLCSAVAQNNDSLFGCGPVPELAEDSVPVWPTVAGITTPVSYEKTAAILLYWAAVLLLPSPITSQDHFTFWVVSGLHQLCSWKTELICSGVPLTPLTAAHEHL